MKLFYDTSYLHPGLEVIKLEYSLRLKIKCNDLLFADTCPLAANHCALFYLRMNSSFIALRPGGCSCCPLLSNDSVVVVVVFPIDNEFVHL